MSNETATTNTPSIEIPSLSDKQIADLEKIRKALTATAKPRSERGVFFGFVAQADIAAQMEVVRWLRKDTRYRVVTILHDRDTYSEDDDIPDGKKVGDTKNGHYHGIVRVGKKITAQSLAKRFGGYLHFELLHDSAEYACYMLHATYNAQQKAQYKHTELLDDVALWDEISDSEHEEDVCAIVETVAGYRDESGQISVDAMLRNSDTLALRSLMGHSYFYATFVNKSKKGEK